MIEQLLRVLKNLEKLFIFYVLRSLAEVLDLVN